MTSYAPALTDEDPAVAVEAAFCVSHAPQIFLGPPQEDPAELERMHDGYRHVAKRATELKLDALCVVALDHLHNSLHQLFPDIDAIWNPDQIGL